jgi:hypothetical protein
MASLEVADIFRDQGPAWRQALVRYIMLSHGGKAIYEKNELGGASFRLIF